MFQTDGHVRRFSTTRLIITRGPLSSRGTMRRTVAMLVRRVAARSTSVGIETRGEPFQSIRSLPPPPPPRVDASTVSAALLIGGGVVLVSAVSEKSADCMPQSFMQNNEYAAGQANGRVVHGAAATGGVGPGTGAINGYQNPNYVGFGGQNGAVDANTQCFPRNPKVGTPRAIGFMNVSPPFRTALYGGAPLRMLPGPGRPLVAQFGCAFVQEVERTAPLNSTYLAWLKGLPPLPGGKPAEALAAELSFGTAGSTNQGYLLEHATPLLLHHHALESACKTAEVYAAAAAAVDADALADVTAADVAIHGSIPAAAQDSARTAATRQVLRAAKMAETAVLDSLPEFAHGRFHAAYAAAEAAACATVATIKAGASRTIRIHAGVAPTAQQLPPHASPHISPQPRVKMPPRSQPPNIAADFRMRPIPGLMAGGAAECKYGVLSRRVVTNSNSGNVTIATGGEWLHYMGVRHQFSRNELLDLGIGVGAPPCKIDEVFSHQYAKDTSGLCYLFSMPGRRVGDVELPRMENREFHVRSRNLTSTNPAGAFPVTMFDTTAPGAPIPAKRPATWESTEQALKRCRDEFGMFAHVVFGF